MATALGTPVPEPPTDCISRLVYSRTTPTFIASSWDKTLRLYSGADGAVRLSSTQRSPVLDAAFPDDTTAYCGLLTGEVRRVMLPGGQDVTMGRHENGVRCMDWIPARGFLVTGGWDQMVKVWDPRSMQPLVKAIQCSGRVFAMASAQDHLVVGLSNRQVQIFDVRKLEYGQAEQQRESSLRYMTRSLGCHPDGRGYALGSVEGRVAMELYDMRPEVQAAKYAFKCHRRTGEDGKEVVYPVHCITYHPTFATFATGAGDGVVNLWDGDNKKRLFQISRYPTSVSALAFSADGLQMAVASSYCWEQGDKPDQPEPAIYLRPITDAEAKPKARPPA